MSSAGNKFRYVNLQGCCYGVYLHDGSLIGQVRKTLGTWDYLPRGNDRWVTVRAVDRGYAAIKTRAEAAELLLRASEGDVYKGGSV